LKFFYTYLKKAPLIHFNNSFFFSLSYMLLFFLNSLLLYSVFTLFTLPISSLKWLVPLVVIINFLVFNIPTLFKVWAILLVFLYLYYSNLTLLCGCSSGIFVHQFIFYFLDHFTMFITWLFHTTSLYFLVIIVLKCIYSVFQIIS
jgi:hypothetical protein